MNLLLLNGPSSPRVGLNSLYRGTDRAHPTYCDLFPDEHEINKLFFWFLKEGGETGVVHNLMKANRYTELLNLYVKEQFFEVVEVVDGDGSPAACSQFIGYDLSQCCNSSLLQWGFNSFPRLATVSEAIYEIYELLNKCYKPQLNAYGLFDTYQVALACLRSMVALQSLSGNLFGGDDLMKFAVIGVYRVKTQ